MNGIEERDVAEIATFTPEELREYEDSLKAYRDIKNYSYRRVKGPIPMIPFPYKHNEGCNRHFTACSLQLFMMFLN